MFKKIIAFVMLWMLSDMVQGQSQKPAPSKSKVGKKVENVKDGDFVRMDTTKLNFGEEAIEGRVKAPEGFFLKGRSPQELMQMVNLRSEFRNELKSTKNGAVALTR